MIRSLPHRATVALLRAAMGLPEGGCAAGGSRDDVAAADPYRVIEIAGAHRIVQMLAPAFDTALRDTLEPDAVLFLREIRAGNVRRNEKMAAALRTTGAHLSEAGIEAAVLKGGAELVAPLGGGPRSAAHADRMVGDLDLLVAADRIGRAREVLIAAGWEEGEMPEIERRHHHHLPTLARADLPGMVELHRRLGETRVEAALPAAGVLAGAESCGIPGIVLPTPVDRLIHLVLHAQIGGAGWEERRLRLCDAVDLARLAGPSDALIDEARQRMRRVGQDDSFDGLFHAAHLLFPERVGAPERPSGRAKRWAHAAVARIGKPGAVRRAHVMRMTRMRLRALLSDPERRAHWRREIAAKGGLRRAIAAFFDGTDSIS